MQFVAHPNVQQLLASIWYEGLPGFRQMNMILQVVIIVIIIIIAIIAIIITTTTIITMKMTIEYQGLEVCRIGLLFPLYSCSYILCPWAKFSQVNLVSCPTVLILGFCDGVSAPRYYRETGYSNVLRSTPLSS